MASLKESYVVHLMTFFAVGDPSAINGTDQLGVTLQPKEKKNMNHHSDIEMMMT